MTERFNPAECMRLNTHTHTHTQRHSSHCSVHRHVDVIRGGGHAAGAVHTAVLLQQRHPSSSVRPADED